MNLYYYIKTGMTVGPVTLEELRDQLTTGELTEDSLACLAGAEEWEPLRVILAKAPDEEQPLPPKDLSRIHSMAQAAAERDARNRTNETNQTEENEAQPPKEDAQTDSAVVTNSPILTIEEVWVLFGGGGMLLAFIISIAMEDASAGVRIGIFVGSIINFMFCLTMSLVCKTCKTYLRNKRPRRS